MLYNSSQPQRLSKSRPLPAREMVECEQRHEAQLHAFLSRFPCVLGDQSGMDGIENYHCSVSKELLSSIGPKHDGREHVNDWSLFGCPNSWQVWPYLHKDQLNFALMLYTSTKIIGRQDKTCTTTIQKLILSAICLHSWCLAYLASVLEKNSYLHNHKTIEQSSFSGSLGSLLLPKSSLLFYVFPTSWGAAIRRASVSAISLQHGQGIPSSSTLNGSSILLLP